MVRHIVSWNYKEEYSDVEKKEIQTKLKHDLERLKDIIPGVISIEVIVSPLSSSNKDIVLNSLLESEEALNLYQIHEEHKKVGQYIGTVLSNRVCIDYTE